MSNQVQISDATLDTLLDSVLRASGSALRHYSMEKTKQDMREAMRTAVQWGYIAAQKGESQ